MKRIRGARILLAEDNALNRRLLDEILSESRLQLITPRMARRPSLQYAVRRMRWC